MKPEGKQWKVIRICREEEVYPGRLTPFPDMPEELYVEGNLPDPSMPAVAIVGSRMCSSYGRIQAFRFARELSEHGVQVISGLARGIDSEAHQGALAGGTPTFAVLGCGLDIPYPRGNQGLRQKILEKGGGILTEYPAGSPPLSYHFPIRNRIISALSDLVLVVEAKKRSGSLITASYALDQGKPVYAVPGEIHEALSEGTNRLIFDGAGTAINPEVILAELGIEYRETSEPDIVSGRKAVSGRTGTGVRTTDSLIDKHVFFDENVAALGNDESDHLSRERLYAEIPLSPEEDRIRKCIGNGAKNANQICRELELPVSVVSGCMVKMEMKGILHPVGGDTFALR